MSWNHNWCKLKHAQTCLYYDPDAWLYVSCAIKSFWEFQSHTTYCFGSFTDFDETSYRSNDTYIVWLLSHVNLNEINSFLGQLYLRAQLHVTTSVFPQKKLGWLFGLLEWTESEQYPQYQRKWWALSSFVISSRELSWVIVMLAVSTANIVICFQDHIESTMFHSQCDNFWQKLAC